MPTFAIAWDDPPIGALLLVMTLALVAEALTDNLGQWQGPGVGLDECVMLCEGQVLHYGPDGCTCRMEVDDGG